MLYTPAKTELVSFNWDSRNAIYTNYLHHSLNVTPAIKPTIHMSIMFQSIIMVSS